MPANTQHKITDLSDADFLSFLYSERERENHLSQFQGWNNWALAGAIATVVCALYSILKSANDEDICYHNVVYYISGIMAAIMSYRSYTFLFEHPRGIDYTKIKTVKDAAPTLFLGLNMICSAAFVLFSAIKGPWNIVSWLWSALWLAYFGAGLYVIVNRNKIVPSYYKSNLFQSKTFELVFNIVVVFLLTFVFGKSFKQIQEIQFGTDLEIAVCTVTLIWLVYFLTKINVGNKSVKEFDVIIDDYLYKGETKERTYNRILINRMGLGVMEVCRQDIEKIKEDIELYSKKVELIESYGKELDAESVDIDKLNEYKSVAVGVLDYLTDTLNHTSELNDKLNQIIRLVPAAENLIDYKSILVLLGEVVGRVKKLRDITLSVTSKVKNHIQSYYCTKLGRYCNAKDCKHRNDPWSFKYSLKTWFGNIFGFLKNK